MIDFIYNVTLCDIALAAIYVYDLMKILLAFGDKSKPSIYKTKSTVAERKDAVT